MFSALTKWLSVGLAVLAVTAVMFAMHFRGAAAVSADRQHQAESRAAQLDASLKASEAAREWERGKADQFQAIAQQNEQDKTRAEADAKRLAADLRAERVRLRPEWRCEVPSTPASAGKPDAANRLQAESLERIDRAVSELQDQRDRLQDLLRAERQ